MTGSPEKPMPFDPAAYVREYTRRSKSNFSCSFLFLPKAQARAMVALYAFCRAVDDAVDEPPAGMASADLLRFWRGEIGRCYGGTPEHPITRALQTEAIVPFRISRAYLEGIIAGMEMDLTRTRYPDWETLGTYCYHVAGEVGLASMEIFGFRDERHQRYAVTLGEAFQLTNILRDVASDADRCRIYFPQRELERAGIPERDILEKRMTPALLGLLRTMADRAEERYRQAESLVEPADQKPLIAARVMTAVYHRILGKLIRRGYPVFSERIRVGKLEKIALVLGVLAGGKR